MHAGEARVRCRSEVRMTWLEAAWLGVLQGLTEFLPISSSAHQLVWSRLANWGDPGAAFTAVTQIGTETAVLIYFRHDLARLFRAFIASVRQRSIEDDEQRTAWFIVVGSVPIMVIGFLAKDIIEGGARNLWIVGCALVIGALVLAYADARGTGHRSLHNLTIKLALVLGLGQSLALIPGVSRSGATISVALLLGFTRVASTRFSFLLAIPAVLVSGVYELRKIGEETVAWGPTIVATAVSFAIGLAVIHWLLKFVATHSFTPFVVYRLILGSAVLGLVATGTITAV